MIPWRHFAPRTKKHKQRRDFFGVIADHLVEDETYRLSEGDLTRLEIIGDRYF